ncbi:hypothetical protein GCM10020295_50150 [Streptomyces cinereospinus]
MTRTYWLEYAWLGDRVEPGAAVDTQDGRITAVHPGTGGPPAGAEILRGLTLPGLANAHSHAFHRALRGTVQVGSGTFWTWREVMYATADRLTPDTYHALARAAYAEMALAGITAVGEFHYVHHARGGTPYADPNAMGEALVAAAADAGIRITLLDTCYLSSGFGRRPTPTSSASPTGRPSSGPNAARFSRNGITHGSARRSTPCGPCPPTNWRPWRGGPRSGGPRCTCTCRSRPPRTTPCRRAHGRTPARLLADHGVLGPRTTGVHNTHLTDEDIALIGRSGTGTCVCPTTERDLADGIGPAAALRRAGSPSPSAPTATPSSTCSKRPARWS